MDSRVLLLPPGFVGTSYIIIRVQLEVKEKTETKGKKKTIRETFEWIVENGEHLGIEDWAEVMSITLQLTPLFFEKCWESE